MKMITTLSSLGRVTKNPCRDRSAATSTVPARSTCSVNACYPHGRLPCCLLSKTSPPRVFRRQCHTPVHGCAHTCIWSFRLTSLGWHSSCSQMHGAVRAITLALEALPDPGEGCCCLWKKSTVASWSTF